MKIIGIGPGVYIGGGGLSSSTCALKGQKYFRTVIKFIE